MQGNFSNAALFLDRDDTLIEDDGYMSRPEQIRLLPGVAEAMQRAAAAGLRLYLVTNQSGINRGFYSMADARRCNDRLRELLFGPAESRTYDFCDICIAPERPDEPSKYRKPSPDYLLEKMASDHLDPVRCRMIGDKTSDLECGLNAGVKAILVHRGNTGAPRPSALEFARAHALPVCPSFSDALSLFLNELAGDSVSS